MIHTWDLPALKRDLRAGPMSRAHLAAYAVCVALVFVTFLAGPLISPELFSVVDAVVFAVASVAGVVVSFAANGGRAGTAFAERFLALWWVFGARFSTFVVLPVSIAVELSRMLANLDPSFPWVRGTV